MVSILPRQAWSRWIREEGNVVDDITVIVVYLNGAKGGARPEPTETTEAPKTNTLLG